MPDLWRELRYIELIAPLEQRDEMLDIPPTKIPPERVEELVRHNREHRPDSPDFSHTYASFTDEETECS